MKFDRSITEDNNPGSKFGKSIFPHKRKLKMHDTGSITGSRHNIKFQKMENKKHS